MSNWRDRLPQTASVHDTLGIVVDEVTPERVVLHVAVTPALHQPFGVLHGGISALLAESAASLGGLVTVADNEIVVGTELNCSHLRSLSSGTVVAVATPVRIGRTVQVWAIDVRDGDNRLICVARCSLQVLPAPSSSAH
jgi:uncharacterized protein (TIGR00369 family)